jgi:glycosyltransferase involved in cell wall biosynthesis
MNKEILENDLKLEILVSTMNRTSLSFLFQMFPCHNLETLNILIVNQTRKGNELHSDFQNIRILNSYDKGLSVSRNLAIKNAIGDICLIADDDVEFLIEFDKIILNAFSRNKMASVILFKITTFSGKAYKSYPKVSKRLSKKRELRNSSSIEIAFKRREIVENHIEFNLLFGLGGHFQSSEEYLFLKESLKYKLRIHFENECIVKHSIERSTSDMGSDAFVKAKAALYYIEYRNFSFVVLLKFITFLLRKRIIPLKKVMRKYQVGINAIRTYKNNA